MSTHRVRCHLIAVQTRNLHFTRDRKNRTSNNNRRVSHRVLPIFHVRLTYNSGRFPTRGYGRRCFLQDILSPTRRKIFSQLRTRYRSTCRPIRRRPCDRQPPRLRTSARRQRFRTGGPARGRRFP